MAIYDLHSHSWVSDGTLSPADLVRRADAAGVDVLALTDDPLRLARAAEVISGRVDRSFPRPFAHGAPDAPAAVGAASALPVLTRGGPLIS